MQYFVKIENLYLAFSELRFYVFKGMHSITTLGTIICTICCVNKDSVYCRATADNQKVIYKKLALTGVCVVSSSYVDCMEEQL